VDLATPIGSASLVTMKVTNPSFTRPIEAGSALTIAVRVTLAWPYLAFAADTVTVMPDWASGSLAGGGGTSLGIGATELGGVEGELDSVDERLLPEFRSASPGTFAASIDAGNTPRREATVFAVAAERDGAATPLVAAGPGGVEGEVRVDVDELP